MYNSQYNILKYFILIMAILLLYTPLMHSEDNVSINYYTGGKEKFKLKPIPESIGYKIRLTGSSKYKVVWFQFKKAGKHRDIKLLLHNNDKFDHYYYLKDGTGKYQIMVFGANSVNSRFAGLCYFSVNSVSNLPDKMTELNINDKILEYVDSVMGKKVGRGECWDLAQAVLDKYSADWKRTTQFGTPLDPDKDEILPGDIIQMYKVKLKYDNKYEYFGLPQHTAIIYKVRGKKDYELAHQNIGTKRYVMKSDFKMKYMYSGSVKIYRPVAGLVPAKK